MTLHPISHPAGTGSASGIPNATESTDTGNTNASSKLTPIPITLLILGAGWTYQFLQPILASQQISYAATTTTGRDGTIPFRFDPDADPDDLTQFRTLPDAEYVLVTFPLKGRGPSAKLVQLYTETRRHGIPREDLLIKDHSHSSNQSHSRNHSNSNSNNNSNSNSHKPLSTKWIQLGSTGIWTTSDWNDELSPIDGANARGVAEDEFLELGGCVLNLAGLYGGQRDPRNWVSRVARSKEQLREKGALHLIHGRDVARAVVGVIRKDQERRNGNNNNADGEDMRDVENNGKGKATGNEKEVFGKRWIVADCVSYDWWSLVWDWMGESREQRQQQDPRSAEETKLKIQYRGWIMELMDENNVRGLPRSVDLLGRKLDARGFWKAIGLLPEMGLSR